MDHNADFGERFHTQFFSKTGELSRVLKCTDLAERTLDAGVDLIGWARSDKEGRGWVVNVGSEDGYATVWVGPNGPARVLTGIERWQLCHRRALGPRGTVWSMGVPDDRGSRFLHRSEPGHGKWVGYPTFVVASSRSLGAESESDLCVPGGGHVFGFWPGGTGTFIGAERYVEEPGPKLRNRKWNYSPESTTTGVEWNRSSAVIDKTWFFNSGGKCIGWIDGRRIGDASDGKSMLFRLSTDSRIAVLEPDLGVAYTRKLGWKDGSVADAVVLWDDLRCGLFVRDQELVLASW